MSKKLRFGDPGSYFVEGYRDDRAGNFKVYYVMPNQSASYNGRVGNTYPGVLMKDLLEAWALLEGAASALPEGFHSQIGGLRLRITAWLSRHTVPEPSPAPTIADIGALVERLAERAGISRESLIAALKAAEAELRKENK